ncbi:TIGR02588 family protein [Brucella sp. BE17]|uniref:TIGR02588 family protein n=1 Tax=Brucella sp. BE17 TaxID=3142977 RepID=UPI0031BB4B9E
MTRSSNSRHIETSTPHWIEWATGGISTFLVLALFGWIIHDIYRYAPGDAAFHIDIKAIEPVNDMFRVRFDVENISQASAAQVRIAGETINADGNHEQSSVNFDYVASEARDSGALFFRTDPRDGQFTIKVEGYTQP